MKQPSVQPTVADRKELENVEFHQLRGSDGLRKLLQMGIENRIGIASGLDTRTLLEEIRRSQYDVIEIMACPGGCAGGGQPYHHGNMK